MKDIDKNLILFILSCNIIVAFSWVLRFNQIPLWMFYSFIFITIGSSYLFITFFNKCYTFNYNNLYVSFSELYLCRNIKDLKRTLPLFKTIISEKVK